jgi:shikimate dehydrogenase
MTGGNTKVVGIIGWPVEHSLSPVIHNAAFRALRLDWVYVPMPVRPGLLHQALAGLPALGFAGANVTMPHKPDAVGACVEISEDARLTGAVNTVVVGADGLIGHNTDVPGFQRFLERDAGFDARGRTALLYGAGGVARSVLLALARSGIDGVTIAARSVARAREMLGKVTEWAPSVDVVGWQEASDVHADLVVNASPAAPPLDAMPALGATTTVLDLVYRPADTGFVRSARSRGAAAFGGLGMLLQQGALSFELWTGQFPPIEVMSAAALAELGTASR